MNLKATQEIRRSALDTIERQKERLSQWEAITALHGEMLSKLEAIPCEIEYYSLSSINCTLIGTGEQLTEAFKILRSSGYSLDEDDERPKHNSTSWSGFFRKEDCHTIYFCFSSTVCKLVQVGTKKVDAPVWDVQCGDGTSVAEQNSEIPL